MDRVGHVLKSAVKILYWKCRYGGRFQAAPVQGFDRLYLELAPKAQISLAERIQNRGMLYLLCGQGGRLRIGAHVFFNTNCSVSCMGETRIGE